MLEPAQPAAVSKSRRWRPRAVFSCNIFNNGLRQPSSGRYGSPSGSQSSGEGHAASRTNFPVWQFALTFKFAELFFPGDAMGDGPSASSPASESDDGQLHKDFIALRMITMTSTSGPTFAPKWLYAASCSMQHNSYNARVKRPQSLDDVDDEYTMSTTTNSDETDQDEPLAGDKDDHYHSTGRNGVLFIPFSFSTDCLHGSLLTLAVSAVTSGFCNLRA